MGRLRKQLTELSHQSAPHTPGCSVLSTKANGHGWWEEQTFTSDPMSMRRNNIFNMYFNPCIVPCISLYRTTVMVIWIKNRSYPHGNGLNGEPIAMGGGNNTNACEFAWPCAKNFFPSNSGQLLGPHEGGEELLLGNDPVLLNTVLRWSGGSACLSTGQRPSHSSGSWPPARRSVRGCGCIFQFI